MPRKSLMDRVAEYTPKSSSEGKFQTKKPALADHLYLVLFSNMS
jgi:hypothetical protein